MTSYSKGALEEDLTSYILLGPYTASQFLKGYGMLEKERERAWKKSNKHSIPWEVKRYKHEQHKNVKKQLPL